MLPEDFINSEEVRDYEVIEEYASKKNTVTACRLFLKSGQIKTFVLKKFINQSSLKREIKYLAYLKNNGSQVPEILYSRDNLIIMEHLPGRLLVNALLEEGDNKPEDMIILLVETLKDIYYNLNQISGGVNGLILGDMNLRNFILKGDKIYRLDLESIKEGKVSEDLGQLLAFIISYNPPFTDYKWQLVKILSQLFKRELEVEPEEIAREMRAELSRIAKRRQQKIPAGEIDRISDYIK